MHEENLLDLALFGITNEQWKAQNPDKEGSITDNASIFEQSTRISMRIFNEVLIKRSLDYDKRLEILKDFAKKSLESIRITLAGRGFIDDSQKN